jgi:5-methylcytosine-specific restriction protein A
MPSKPVSGCHVSMCTALSVEQSGLCAEHLKARNQMIDKDRGTPSERGYDRQWQHIRAMVLAEEPLCRGCIKKNYATAASQVDHIDGNVHNNLRTNLQPLCLSCHSKKTAIENGSFGNVRG